MIALGAMLYLLAAADPPAPPEVYRDLIHADLPLWTSGLEKWPQHLTDEIGCIDRIEMGDWRYHPSPDGDYSPPDDWYRLRNYGVFHCAVVLQVGDEREKLADRDSRYSWFIDLGSAQGIDGEVSLWALQEGSAPGSNYILLARKPEKGIIKAFDVLQRRCPANRRRKGESVEIWGTQYCAINSKTELVRLAREMAKLPPLAKLEFVADIKLQAQP